MSRLHPIVSHRAIRFGLAVILLLVAAVVLITQLRQLQPAELWERLRAIPHWRGSLALAVTLLNYAQLSLYDVIGLSYLRRSVLPRHAMFVSWTATIFAHNIGPSLLSGGSLRYRFYSGWGIAAKDIARLIAFGAVTFFVGFSCTGGLTLLTLSSDGPVAFPLPIVWLRSIGGLLFSMWCAYMLACAVGPRVVRVARRQVRLPSAKLAIVQTIVAGIDWLAMAAVLALLLPPGSVSYLEVLRALVVSQILAMSSQVPGGIGVFESLMVAALKPSLPLEVVAATLLLYRVVYYFVPFGLAFVILSVAESRALRSSGTGGNSGRQGRSFAQSRAP